MTHTRVDTGGVVGATPRSGRMPSLDGMRGVAILLVFLSHLAAGYAATDRIDWLAHAGGLGVDIFFVLSGFLITTLLNDEHQRTGRFAIGRFLVRRALRIFPAAYAFFLLVAVASDAGWIQLNRYDLAAALTYTMNFDSAPAWWLGHTWTLSVEEQFYLVWPLVLYLARPARGAVVAIGAVLIFPFVRVAVIRWVPAFDDNFERTLLVAIDGFAVGSLLALMRGRLEASAGYVRWLRAPWVFLLLPAAVLAGPLEHHPLFFYGFVQSFIYIALALWLHRSQIVTNDAVWRFLNWAPLVWLGSISYSLYLWQQLFLAPEGTGLIHIFPLDCILSVVCAVASHRLIEQPFLRLRNRYWPAGSGAEPNGARLVAAAVRP